MSKAKSLAKSRQSKLTPHNSESTEQRQEEKKKYKIPPPPVVPKKKLSDEARVLVANEDAKRFGVYVKRIAGCFSNVDLMSEPDIEDALGSLGVLLGERARVSGLLAPLFAVIVRVAVDSKEIPNKLRRSLVSL